MCFCLQKKSFLFLLLSNRPPNCPCPPSAPTQLCGPSTPDADHTAFKAMQKTVLGEFPRGRILTPREVRGDFDTLTEAITTTTAATSNMFDPLPPPLSAFSASSSASSGSEEDSGTGGNNSSIGSSTTNSSTNSINNGGDGEGGVMMKGGWPQVDHTRGMVLFVIDYQSKNLLCRPAIRKVRKTQGWRWKNISRFPCRRANASPSLWPVYERLASTSLEHQNVV